jgi:hypothetical protein
MWSKGQGQAERGRKLEDKNKEKYVKISPTYDNR